MNFFSLFKRKLIYYLKNKKKIDIDNFQYKTLDNLFHYYGSDKADFFKTTSSKGHGFSTFYEKHLQEYKKKDINILEIGSYAGASAAAFVKYFDKSKVICLDINISNFKYSSKKIDVFGVDITNIKSVTSIIHKVQKKYKFQNFDLIIDDGSHQLSDILLSLKFFFKFLKKNGLYVIEDFKHPNYYEYNNDLDHIFVDDLLENLENKKNFKSSIFNQSDQTYLFNEIKKIDTYRGNLKDSDICFIKRQSN